MVLACRTAEKRAGEEGGCESAAAAATARHRGASSKDTVTTKSKASGSIGVRVPPTHPPCSSLGTTPVPSLKSYVPDT